MACAKSQSLWPMLRSLQSQLFWNLDKLFDLKCVNFYLLYISLTISPESIATRFSNISLINLLTSFVCLGVVGHMSVKNFCSGVRLGNSGLIVDIFVNKQFLEFWNLSQKSKKCISVSINFSSWLAWQYTHTCWL